MISDAPDEVSDTYVALLVGSAGPLEKAPSASPGNPAHLYIASQHTEQSRRTGLQGLERLVRLLKQPGAPTPAWDTFPWHQLTARETTYAHAALEARYGPATVRLTLCNLRGVLKQCWRLGLTSAEVYQRAISLSPVSGEAAPAGRMLSREEIDQLIRHVDTLPEPLSTMGAALFAAGLGGGLRRMELTYLLATALTPEGALRVARKGRVQAVQALPAWASNRVRAWVTLRGERFQTPTMFLKVRGEAMTVVDQSPNVRGTWEIIKKLGKSAGLASFMPHDLRRTFASNMMDLGDLSLAQKAMGHRSPTTTVLYDRRGDELVGRTIAKLEGGAFVKGDSKEKELKRDSALKASLGDIAKRKISGKEAAAPSTMPDAADPACEKRTIVDVAPAVKKIKVSSGQELVDRRRIVKPPAFRRNGAPLDMVWASSQALKLVRSGKSHEVICVALTKVGVRRGDGSELQVVDITKIL